MTIQFNVVRIMLVKIVYIVFGILFLTTQQLAAQITSGTIISDKKDVLNRWSKNHLLANEKVEKPNIVIVLTDDQGFIAFFYSMRE